MPISRLHAQLVAYNSGDVVLADSLVRGLLPLRASMTVFDRSLLDSFEGTMAGDPEAVLHATRKSSA